MKRATKVPGRVRLQELCGDDDYRGRWVALGAASYEAGQVVEGEVVDSDADLAALCARIQGADRGVAIVLCERGPVPSRRLAVA